MSTKTVILVFVIIFAQLVLDFPHYKIGWYDVSMNISLLSMFWYGVYYGANL